ncbi:MAG: hypothetical protein KGD68_05140 [Candidatus Lokiarchaeota archaeon]|nr:hypothetical protein [Candidatus Lokiarchaeota archaeon]
MSDKPTKPVTEIYLRSYPKVIFFWPMTLVSFVLWLLQMLVPTPVAWYGIFWLIVFFINMFIVAFDFNSTKFFVLILVAVVVIILLVFLVPDMFAGLGGGTFNPGLTAEFYLVITLIMVLILGLVFIGSRFDYWKIERNEIYHKSGVFSSAERIPTKSLRIKKDIPDVFEFFILRAGSITLMPGHGDVINLPTVLNINKKQKQIDYLLSHVSIEPDELDA